MKEEETPGSEGWGGSQGVWGSGEYKLKLLSSVSPMMGPYH